MGGLGAGCRRGWARGWRSLGRCTRTDRNRRRGDASSRTRWGRPWTALTRGRSRCCGCRRGCGPSGCCCRGRRAQARCAATSGWESVDRAAGRLRWPHGVALPASRRRERAGSKARLLTTSGRAGSSGQSCWGWTRCCRQLSKRSNRRSRAGRRGRRADGWDAGCGSRRERRR